jgi:hypothetical protein
LYVYAAKYARKGCERGLSKQRKANSEQQGKGLSQTARKRAANSKEDGCPKGSKPRPLGPWAKGEAVGTKPSQNVGKKGPKKTLGREPKWLGRGL